MTPITAARFVTLPLNQRQPSPNNPRKNFDPVKLAELGESLKAGQIEPIVVRSSVDFRSFEILAGERRWRAAELVGLKTIEAKVMECDDQRALEITVVENLQRADLHPLEEANGVASLVAAKWSVDTIAAHLGKSISWVHLRAKLVELTPAWRKAIGDHGHKASTLTAGHLDLIARLGAVDQNALVDAIRNDYSLERSLFHESSGQPVPVVKFGQVLAMQFLRDPAKAPWDVSDAKLLPSAGACSTCPKRTSCQGEIFPDLAGSKAGDRCLDPQCWDRKKAAFVDRRAMELTEKNPDLIKVDLDAHQAKDVTKGAVGGQGVLREASRGDKGARQALIVSGAKAGQTTFVVPGYRANENAAARKAFDLPTPAEQEKQRLARVNRVGKSAKAAQCPPAERRLEFIADAILDLIRKKKAKRPPLARVVRLAVYCSIIENYPVQPFGIAKTWAVIDNPKRTAEQDHQALREQVLLEFESALDVDSLEDGAIPHICKALGIDHSALVAAAAAKHPDLKEGLTDPVAKKAAPATAATKAKAKPAAKVAKPAKPTKKKGAA